MKHISILIMVMLLMVACKPSIPDGILDEDTMAEVLYDIHIAHFIPSQGNEGGAAGSAQIQLARQMEILKKHDISQDEWDTSLQYYSRHTELLMKVYGQIYEEMSNKALAMGVSVGGIQQMGDEVEMDTTDIWSSADHFMLLDQHPYTTQTWDVTPKDSVLTKGERITLKFFANYMNKQAPRTCTALLYLKLDNDSIVQASSVIGTIGMNTVIVTCPPDRSIKEIRGMFMMGRTATNPLTGAGYNFQMPQALLITRLHLLHAKTQTAATAPPPPPAAQPSAAKQDSSATPASPPANNGGPQGGPPNKTLPPLKKEIKQ